MDDPTIAARQAGWGWDDIDEHIGQASDAAASEGYSQDEIDQHLGYQPSNAFEARAEEQWRYNINVDPNLDVSDLANAPTVDSDYAHALKEGHVKGPDDFADKYAAAMVTAAGVKDPDALAGASDAADELAQRLPQKRDFTDAAIATAGDYGGGSDTEIVRDNLIDHWKETGQAPIDAAMQAQRDPELAAKLNEEPLPEPLGQKKTWLEQFAEPVLDPLVGGIRGLLGGVQSAQALVKMMPDELQDAYKLVMKGMSYTGLPLSQLNEFDATATLKTFDAWRTDRGYDNWRVDVGQVLPALPLMTTLGAEGFLGAAVAGATGGLSMTAFDPVTSGDYWEEKAKQLAFNEVTNIGGNVAIHGIISGIGKVIEKMTPEAAKLLHSLSPELVDPMVAEVNLARENPVAHMRASEAFQDVESAPRIKPEPSAEGVVPEGAVETIDPEATAASKMQAVGDMHEEGLLGKLDTFSPTFFEDMVKAAQDRGHLAGDNATLELAQGTDMARGFKETLVSMFTQVMRDESGKVPLPQGAMWRTPDQVAKRAEKFNALEYGRKNMKETAGESTQAVVQMTRRLDGMRADFKPHMDEWLQALADPTATNVGDTAIGKFMRFMDGDATVKLDPSQRLTPWATMVRDVLNDVHKRIAAQDAEGIGVKVAWLKNYFPHMFKDSADAESAFVGSGKTGSRGNFMHREKYATMMDAVNAGVELKHTDPIDMVLSYVNKSIHYSYAADMFAKMEKDGMAVWSFGTGQKVAAGNTQPVPRGWVSLADIAPGFAEKRFVMGQTGIGEAQAGSKELFAHPQLAKDLKYWLNRSNSSDTKEKVFDKLLEMKNGLTGLKLAVPAFHAVTMFVASIAAHTGLGMEEAFRGQFAKAIWHITGAPLIAANDLVRFRGGLGARLIQDYANGTGDATLQNLVKENMRFNGLHELESFNQNTKSLFSSWRDGTLWDDVSKAWRPSNLLGPEENTALRRISAIPKNGVAATFETIKQVNSVLAGPLFDTAIPNMKVAAAYRRLDSYLRAGPRTEEQITKYRRQVVQDVDNRFGEMQLDNLFWSRFSKQVMNTALLSTSWKYGTWRNITSAFGYNLEHGFEFNPVALTSFIGTGVALTEMGALIGYMVHDKLPDLSDWKTYLGGFATGSFGSGLAKNAKEFSFVPSEWKEILDVGGILAKSLTNPFHAGMATAEYLLGAVNPMWRLLRDLTSKEDAVGHKYMSLQWPGVRQLLIEDGIKPIVFSQFDQKQRTSGLSALETIFGFREAPKWAEDPAAYQAWQEKTEKKEMLAEIKRMRQEEATQLYPGGLLGDKLTSADFPGVAPISRSAGRGGGGGGSRAARGGGGGYSGAVQNQSVGGGGGDFPQGNVLRGGRGSGSVGATQQLQGRAQRARSTRSSRRRRR